jgi:hypothetical protein
MDINTQTTKTAKISRYELELNCAEDLYSFWVYTENGNIEASFVDVTKETLNEIISFLQEAQ